MSILPKLILWIDYNLSIIMERVAKVKKILKCVWKYKKTNHYHDKLNLINLLILNLQNNVLI